MRQIPLDIGTVHFVGIGGIGMSGLAEIMLNLGYSVSGSDISRSSNTTRLESLGIEVAIGHDAANLGDAVVLVTSSAVAPDNPEVREARSQQIPVVPRAEMLAEIMRLKWSIAVAGTHGKTTTTSIVAAVLAAGGLDPTVINGGIINAYGTNARLGNGDWIVVEADESDGTFVRLPGTINVVTNVDREHLDHYGTIDALKDTFVSFVQNTPFYGLAILCIDDPGVQELIPRISDRRIVTYGLDPEAEVRAVDIEINADGSRFGLLITDHGSSRDLGIFETPMIGEHNVRNALAAIAIADKMEIDPDHVRKALAEFSGVKRRFTQTGLVDGVTIIDDYGHHPVEIEAVLAAARTSSSGNVVAVFQPHRYSRVQDLFDGFCTSFGSADTVIVSDIYAANEKPIDGIDREYIISGIRSHGHSRVLDLPDPLELPRLVARIAEPGDYVVCLGAGSITQWANALPDALSREWAQRPELKQAGDV